MAKIRKGFVSNSSSSSFVCDYCGNIESGYNISLDEMGMSSCENGHEFCNIHMDKSFDIETLDGFKYLLKLYNQECGYMDDKSMDAIKHCIENNTCTFDAVKDILKDDFYNLDFEQNLRDTLYDYGNVPEEYCPVCQRLKSMEQDLDYQEYKRLFEKFNGIKPNGIK